MDFFYFVHTCVGQFFIPAKNSKGQIRQGFLEIELAEKGQIPLKVQESLLLRQDFAAAAKVRLFFYSCYNIVRPIFSFSKKEFPIFSFELVQIVSKAVQIRFEIIIKNVTKKLYACSFCVLVVVEQFYRVRNFFCHPTTTQVKVCM